MKSIAQESLPAWYEILLLAPTTIGFRVHVDAFLKLQLLSWKSILEGLGIDPKIFTAPSRTEACGINNVFMIGDSREPDWILWQFILPVNKEDRQYELDVRRTISLFVEYLSMFEGSTNYPKPQLMTIDTLFVSPESGHMQVTLGREVAAWLKSASALDCHSILGAILTASNHTWGSADVHRSAIQVRKDDRSKLIHINLTGNGLEPVPNSGIIAGSGYILCTPGDATGQTQLILLAALAQLHALVRAAQVGG